MAAVADFEGPTDLKFSLKPAECLYLIACAFGLIEFDEDEIRAAKRRLGMAEVNEEPEK